MPTAPGSLLDTVTKTEVIVRGLYHAQASDLEITLLHQEHSCVLKASSKTSSTRPGGIQFGVPEDRRYMRGFGPKPGMCVSAAIYVPRERFSPLRVVQTSVNSVEESVATHTASRGYAGRVSRPYMILSRMTLRKLVWIVAARARACFGNDSSREDGQRTDLFLVDNSTASSEYLIVHTQCVVFFVLSSCAVCALFLDI